MSRTVGQVAGRVQQINGNVTSVAAVAEETTGAARGTAEIAAEPNGLAGDLRRTVAMFRY